MATRVIKLTGKASWAKVFEENRDMKGFENAYEEHDGACTINVTLEAEEFQTLKQAGSIKKGSMTDEGLSVKFVRKFKDRFEWGSGAPKVVKADGTAWSYAEDGIIPNGSDVEVTVSVYDTSRPSIKGTRLDEVKVLKVFSEEEDSPSDRESEIPF